MKRILKPSKEIIQNKTYKEISLEYDVSYKTAIRWMQSYNLYEPVKNFGCNKLNINLANDIRNAHNNGKKISELAKQYQVTNSTISRIIHNINYKISQDTAKVSVVYNIKG